MKGLTYCVATVQSEWSQPRLRRCLWVSKGPNSWNPAHKERPADRQAVTRPRVEDSAKSSNPRRREVWSGIRADDQVKCLGL